MATGGVDVPLSPNSSTSRPLLSEIQAEESTTTPGEVYRSRVWGDLRKLFQQDHLTDVMLAAEGRSIPCHKVLLAAASKFFHDKFITNPESLEHNILDIDDIDFDTLTSVVSFIYSGNIKLTLGKAEKLIPASVSLMLPELTHECNSFIDKKISIDVAICVAVYKSAKANGLESRAKKARGVMLDNFLDITKTDAFKVLSETELKEYIGDNNLNVASEDPIFESLVTWVKHDIDNRKVKFEALLDHVTLSHCSLDFLKDTVLQEPLMESVNGLRHVATALANQAASPSLQLGIPRRHNSLLAICKDHCWVLREGDFQWEQNRPVAGKVLTGSHVCRIEDGILITGGWDKYGRCSKRCWKLSLPALKWTAVSDLNVARSQHASVCVGGQVYVLGGNDNDNIELDSVEYLNETTGSWCVTTGLPYALCDHAAVSYKQYLVVLKGSWGSGTNLLLDTVDKTWYEGHEMPLDYGFASSVVYRDRIYVLGGREKCCMSYNPDDCQWQTHSAPRGSHAEGSAAVVWRDRILLCGGDKTLIEAYNPDTDTWTDWKHSLPRKATVHCSHFSCNG